MTREEIAKKKEEEEKEQLRTEKKKKRKKRILWIIAILFLLILSTILYSRFVATTGLIVREYKVESSTLPKEFHGLKLIHFTDLHYGSTVKKEELKELVNKVNQLKPDLIVFTGDLIDKDYTITETDLNDLKQLLGQMKASTGKYAVSGNHDYSYNYYADLIQECGFTYLDNNSDLVYYQGYQPILLVGVSDTIKGASDIKKAFSYFEQEQANKDIYTIALLHEPDTLDQIKIDYPVNLALAGHSHNGQIRLPGIGSIMKIKGAKKYSEPFYQIESTSLYISGGLGTSTYKYRLFNRPSINLFRFQSK